MKRLSLKRQSILPRIDGITRDIGKLRALENFTLEEFSKEDNFDRAQFYLRRALEGVFHIGAHILSRKEGGRVTEYKEIARRLGELGIIKKSFAEGPLTQMAKYRNRLTHFYADILPQELHTILQHNLGDTETFLRAIKELIHNPEKFGLTIK